MKSVNKVETIIKDFNNGKIENAFFQISKLIKNNPENLEYIFLYAKMCNQANKLDESEKASLFLLSKNKNSIEYLQNLYSTYLKKNNINKSEIFIKKLLKIDSKHYEAQRDLGYVEYTKENFDSANKILEKSVNKKNDDPFALNVLGLIYLKKKLITKAIQLFDKAIFHSPRYVDSYNNIGKTYKTLYAHVKVGVTFLVVKN